MQKKKLMKLNSNAKTYKVVGQGCEDDCKWEDCPIIGTYPVQNGIGCRTNIYGPGSTQTGPQFTSRF